MPFHSKEEEFGSLSKAVADITAEASLAGLVSLFFSINMQLLVYYTVFQYCTIL